MRASQGLLTRHGGATSHAAVVARQLGRPCVAGCEASHIDLKKLQFTVNGIVVKEGDVFSLDGGSGQLFLGELPTVAPSFDEQPHLKKILEWAEIGRAHV